MIFRLRNRHMPKKTKPRSTGLCFYIWSGKRDSNSRPRPWQGRALPTELFPQYGFYCLFLHFKFGGGGRNRTGVHGFAVRCMTTLPPRRGTRCSHIMLPPVLYKTGRPKTRKQKTSAGRYCLSRRRGLLPVQQKFWSGKRDSNSRPRPWQGRALPTELFPQCGAHFTGCRTPVKPR